MSAPALRFSASEGRRLALCNNAGLHLALRRETRGHLRRPTRVLGSDCALHCLSLRSARPKRLGAVVIHEESCIVRWHGSCPRFTTGGVEPTEGIPRWGAR